MKTPEEMAAIFRAMPMKKQDPNPYWRFMDEPARICSVHMSNIVNAQYAKILDLTASMPTLKKIREFFRRFYESFKSEAQVLCVVPEDGRKLQDVGIPVLTEGVIGPFKVWVMVLPQDNHMGTSVIGETLWQSHIVQAGIKPVLRVHSHHILEPYQSMTDYSTLNSGTLEMVLGKIFEEPLYLCYWLDVPGTDIKAQTFLVREDKRLDNGDFLCVPHKFNGPDTDTI